MENYFIIKIPASIHNHYQDQLSQIPKLGVEEFSLDESTVDNILGERSYSGADLPLSVIEEVDHKAISSRDASYKYYFESIDDALKVNQLIDQELEIEMHKSEDWNENWRENFKTITVSRRLSIVPSWERSNNINLDAVYIYPGMGFGTGNHETTYLCLKIFDEIEECLNSCLDYGCGSGILGIAFGCVNENSHVDFVDIDDDALENTKQNINFNPERFKSSSKILKSNNRDQCLEKYDVVFANILKNVLCLEKEFIIQKTKKHLIVSGLLDGQEVEVIEEYLAINRALKVLKIAKKNDWVAIHFSF